MNVSLFAYTRGINGESPEELALLIAQVPYKMKSKNSLKAALDRGHMSILEHLSFTSRIEDLSRVSQQQLTRHRMASYTIQSDRHLSVLADAQIGFPEKALSRRFSQRVAKAAYTIVKGVVTMVRFGGAGGAPLPKDSTLRRCYEGNVPTKEPHE